MAIHQLLTVETQGTIPFPKYTLYHHTTAIVPVHVGIETPGLKFYQHQSKYSNDLQYYFAGTINPVKVSVQQRIDDKFMD